MPSCLVDNHHRRIDYLRLSITDRCNLRCIYCMPEDGMPKLSHDEIMTYEEMLRLVELATQMGISKIRVTGGEPLVRKGVLYLCRKIAEFESVKSLSITTNGLLLADYAEGLLAAGIKRINVSLDTLKPEKYARITRRDCYHKVWHGLERALALGFQPVKLNVVVMKGWNDDEIEDLARLTYRYPFHVRFIEFMPFSSVDQASKYLSSDDVLQRLVKMAPLVPAKVNNGNGPARHYKFPGAVGKIGLISPISHHFCPTCNRLRVTADGKLRTCLFSREETDLRDLLRRRAADEDIVAVIRRAIDRKPERHTLESEVFRKCIGRPMVAIGG
ncbi:GTP 3',8-cyclase MoaA [Desulfoferrobacter suflitae]|uniref:GTP 3',8-cyclase MoaA n=1 Tax=Desulfoferrobacter suflitae TaxID=2865782 RepID=UPI002164CA94|nr:GTP 3',8-cyclase MoaA [Desulfoferrobacter suflitae]MCK8603524.1 GTP 3',8-cyclase MoaA [Desulfoferrobacter suflitae]